MTSKEKQALLNKLDNLLNVGVMLQTRWIDEKNPEEQNVKYSVYRECIAVINNLYNVMTDIFKIPNEEILDYKHIHKNAYTLSLEKIFKIEE